MKKYRDRNSFADALNLIFLAVFKSQAKPG